MFRVGDVLRNDAGAQITISDIKPNGEYLVLFLKTSIVITQELIKRHGYKKVGHARTFRCSGCGERIVGEEPVICENGKYCQSCREIHDYYTENNIKFHKAKNHGKTYGFELECVPYTLQDQLFLCNHKYHLKATSDSSLPTNGVEFKTPTYRSLNGLKAMLHTFEKHVDFQNDKCGQHINIGDVDKINTDSMCAIRAYAEYIFDPVLYYMTDARPSTERICGRYFNYYASRKTSYGCHTSWVNLNHNNRIEFRLAKIQSPEQYIQLVNMYTEWVDAIITWFLRGPNERNAQIAGRKLLNIFQKYERGDAVSQSKVRNNRKAS